MNKRVWVSYTSPLLCECVQDWRCALFGYTILITLQAAQPQKPDPTFQSDQVTSIPLFTIDEAEIFYFSDEVSQIYNVHCLGWWFNSQWLPYILFSFSQLPSLCLWEPSDVYECSSTGGCYHWCSSTGGCYHQCSSTVELLSLVL